MLLLSTEVLSHLGNTYTFSVNEREREREKLINSKVNYLQLIRHHSSQSHCCLLVAAVVVGYVDEGDYVGGYYGGDDGDAAEMGHIDCEWDEC